MKKITSLIGLACMAGIILFALGKKVRSSTGWENAIWVWVGSSATMAQTSINQSAVSLASASVTRPDFTCRNNSANTLWLGPTSSVTPGNGFPVLSSETIKLGSFTGAIFGYCDSGTCDVRCWAGAGN